MFRKYDDEIKNIYRDRENQLIVCSYKNAATDNNGGMLRFYDVRGSGMKLTLKPGWEYSGFAKIKDVRYKRGPLRNRKNSVWFYFLSSPHIYGDERFGGGQQKKEAIWLLGHQTGS